MVMLTSFVRQNGFVDCACIGSRNHDMVTCQCQADKTETPRSSVMTFI